MEGVEGQWTRDFFKVFGACLRGPMGANQRRVGGAWPTEGGGIGAGRTRTLSRLVAAERGWGRLFHLGRDAARRHAFPTTFDTRGQRT